MKKSISASSNHDPSNKWLSAFNKILIGLGVVGTLWWVISSKYDKESTYSKELIEIMEEKESLEEGAYELTEEDLTLSKSNNLGVLYKKKYHDNTPVLDLSRHDVYKKPLDLHYVHKVEDKKINTEWSSSDVVNRIVKVLRFADITDEIESIYGIPNGLLLALAAHESTWNPLLPNGWGDGGAWLSHIQGINAKNFWLTTLPLSTNRMIDRLHGAKIKEELQNSKQRMAYMINKDDRFHPVLWLDVVWRFVIHLEKVKSKKHTWSDLWIHVLKWYSARWDKYVHEILKYRYTIQSYRWKDIPTFSRWYQDYISSLSSDVAIRKKLIDGKDVKVGNVEHNWFKAKIDWKYVSTKDYFQYFEDRLVNYEFDKYKTFMQRKAIFAKNNIIDQNVINSQWFRIYKKENVNSIPALIKQLNDLNNWSYMRVGQDNIVDQQGNVLKHIPKNKKVYIKIRYTSQSS